MNEFEIILLVVGCLLALILLFIIFPTIVVCLCIFCRDEVDPLTEKNMAGTPYEKFKQPILRDSYLLKCIPTQEVKITAYDGVELVAYFADGGFKKTAILIHGYRASPTNNFHTLGNLLYKNGYNLLLVHQRGHGKSGGKITHLSMREDQDVISWLTWAEKQIPEQSLVLCGMSMGATSIAKATNRIVSTQVKALYLDCGYTNLRGQMMRDMKKRHVPMLNFCVALTRWFLLLILNEDINLSSVHSLKQNKIPAFFVCCENDASVGAQCTIDNYNACASEKHCRIVAGEGHTLGLLQGGKELQTEVLDFLNKHCEQK